MILACLGICQASFKKPGFFSVSTFHSDRYKRETRLGASHICRDAIYRVSTLVCDRYKRETRLGACHICRDAIYRVSTLV